MSNSSDGRNRSEETAEEIASEHGEMIEFGRAVKLFESAAAELRRNGHATVGALVACDEAKRNLETLFAEYDEMRKLGVGDWSGDRDD